MATHCTLLANNELYTTLNLGLCMCNSLQVDTRTVHHAAASLEGSGYDPVADEQS
jgi:hypothetical protein